MNQNEGGKPPAPSGLRKLSLNGSMSNLGGNQGFGSYRGNPLLNSGST